MFTFKKKRESLIIPNHVGVIMDGNGRWAKKRGLPRKYGHRKGANNFRKIVKYAKKTGVKYITFYAFSTENWKRPKDEVDAIMNLFSKYLDEVREYIEEDIRIMFIGEREGLPDDMQKKMESIEIDSSNFKSMTLLLAINYGGRNEITHAVKEIVKLSIDGFINASQVDAELIESHLYTRNIPNVDLIIRPSGEMRISNFLIWQSAYAEFYFSDVLWPDFKSKHFDQAIESYSERNRRYGGV